MLILKQRDCLGSGIMKELRDGKLPEEISRYENLEELLNAIKSIYRSVPKQMGNLHPECLYGKCGSAYRPG